MREETPSSSLRVATFGAKGTDLYDIERWCGLVTGRGACRHPDGAAQQMSTALTVFADDFASHADRRRCVSAGAAAGAKR